MKLRIRNAAQQDLYIYDFLCGVTCNFTFPLPNAGVGSPLPGVRGVEGLPAEIVVWAGTPNIYGRSPATFTLTTTKAARPGYNLGGTSFATATLISVGESQFGSVHPFEPGQFYKIHLLSGQQIYLSGQATGSTQHASAFTVGLYRANQQFLGNLTSALVGATSYFPNGAFMPWTNTGAAGDFYLVAKAGANMTWDYRFVVQTQLPQLTIESADIVANAINVTLAPSGLSGTLTLRVVGTTDGSSSINFSMFTGIRTGGSHTFQFPRTTLPEGQYSSVQATWTPGNKTDSENVAFKVLGDYRHSQYNTPYESQCTGPQASAYITNAQCLFTSTTLKSDFISQAWLNGSGVTENFGMTQNEAWCMTHGTPPAGAAGKSFRPGTLVPACGASYAVDNGSVAKGNDADLVCGDQVLLVTAPTGGIVKGVTDSCPACTGKKQLDNYTTQAACVPGTIPDLGTFRTIRLR